MRMRCVPFVVDRRGDVGPDARRFPRVCRAFEAWRQCGVLHVRTARRRGRLAWLCRVFGGSMRLARAALLRHTLYAWSFWATLHLDWANFLGRPQALDPIPEEAEDWELAACGAVALPSGGAKIFPSSGANALVALPPEIAEALETFQRQRGVDPAGQEGEGE